MQKRTNCKAVLEETKSITTSCANNKHFPSWQIPNESKDNSFQHFNFPVSKEKPIVHSVIDFPSCSVEARRPHPAAFLRERSKTNKKRKLFSNNDFHIHKWSKKPKLSANINENNDNNCSTTYSKSLHLNKRSERNFSANQILFSNKQENSGRFSSKFSESQKFQNSNLISCEQEYFNPVSKTSLKIDVLEKHWRNVSPSQFPNISTNKRPYSTCPLHTQNTFELSRNKSSDCFALAKEFRSKFISSPPSRIPRLFRRSQSEFCKAREVVEAQRLLTLKPRAACYKRYNSWSDGCDKKFCFLTESQPSNNSSRFHSTYCTPELNSNGNATPNKNSIISARPSSFIANSIPKQNLHIDRLLANTNENFSQYSFPDQRSNINWFDAGFARSTNFNQFETTLNNRKEYRNYSRPATDLSAADFDKTSEEQDLQKLARLQVGVHSTQGCSCGKENCKAIFCVEQTSQQSIERIFRKDFQPKSPSCCFQFVGKRSNSSSNLGQSQKRLERCCQKLASEQVSLIAKKTPSITDLLLLNKYSTKSVRSCEEIEKPFESNGFKKFFFDYTNGTIKNSKRKEIFYSSTNNHNVKEEIFFHYADHPQKGNSNEGFHFVLDSSCSLKKKLTSSFRQVQQNCSISPIPSKHLGFCYSQTPTEMGCIHSVSQKKKVEPCRSSIYSEVRATIDQSPTIIEEYSPIVLRYRTPYFRAYAQVIMPPINNKETWTVGWIQACDFMKFINKYGELGYSSWEIPALKANRVPAVSDSDGVSYPWYGNTTEIATIVGPTDSYTRMNLTMNDNFYPSVTWDIPVSEGTNAHLTEIIRDQSFITWLAAVNETTKEIIILKTVQWSFYLEICIDPTKELGHRAKVVKPTIQNQPLIINGACGKHHVDAASKIRRRMPANNSNSNCLNHIPISALVRPSANNAQTLIWRPTNSKPVIVVPAKEEHRDNNELVLFKGCSAMHGKEAIMKEISKQEFIQLQQLGR